ncbi:hypothetical protein NUACC21_21470 [Scytonema sp. NUACC21]
MDYEKLETLVNSLESIGLDEKDILVEIDESIGQGDLDFTEEAHDKFCENPELLMSVMRVFLSYRKQGDRIFTRFSIYLPEE